MNLSKTKYCKGVQCKKILWLDKNKPQVKKDLDNQAVLDNGTEVGILAKKLFGKFTDIEFNENITQMIQDTKEALKKDVVNITEASFNYNNNFCSVDILKKTYDNYEIYEVKSSTEIKDIYIDDISYQFYVLENLDYNVTRCCIVHINPDYVKEGELDLKGLFNIVDVTEKVLPKQQEIDKNIKEINDYVKESNEPEEILSTKCMNPYECPYFDYCKKDLETPNVFDVKRLRNSKKFSLYQENLYRYKDLLKTDIDEVCKDQINHELKNMKPMINLEAIKEFMDTLTYPMYFLDFETYQKSIPEYDFTKPYQQIPFQYSLHYIEEEGKEILHTEYLAEAGIDPRRELAEKLVQDIPMDTCVIAYNMMFEKMVIRSLASIYPDLEEHLMNIHDNMKDLMIPFKNHDYYCKEMQGSYSIKYVLPALFPEDETLNYHNLESVHNGKEAQEAFLLLSTLSAKERKELRDNLLKYCELDTYAMVKIFYKLNEIIKK